MHLRCLLYWHKLQSGPTLVSSQHDHALMHDMDYSLSIYDSCDVTLSVTLSDVTKKTHKKTEFIYWSSVECRGLNVEGEGKKSRARVKSRG
jgi:hypothetical protein